jgi:hypothetical protein
MASGGLKNHQYEPVLSNVGRMDFWMWLEKFEANGIPGVKAERGNILMSSAQVCLKIGSNEQISLDTSDNTVTFTGTDEDLEALQKCETIDEFVAVALKVCAPKPEPEPEL